MTPTRAIVFDLDDTLYRVRRYSLSGFRAVACALAGRGYDEHLVFRQLSAAYRGGDGPRPFQALEAVIGPGHGLDLLAVHREHVPSLRLSRDVRTELAGLRPTWRLGILTNGAPDQQRRKVAALGLTPLVDAIVYAHEHSAIGKPHLPVFTAILETLGVAGPRAVVVGDDPTCDIVGGRAAGCATIRVRRPRRDVTPGAEADVVVAGLAGIGEVAAALIEGREDA